MRIFEITKDQKETIPHAHGAATNNNIGDSCMQAAEKIINAFQSGIPVHLGTMPWEEFIATLEALKKLKE